MMPFETGKKGGTMSPKKSDGSTTRIDHAASTVGTLLFGPLGSVLGMPKGNPTKADEKTSDAT